MSAEAAESADDLWASAMAEQAAATGEAAPATANPAAAAARPGRAGVAPAANMGGAAPAPEVHASRPRFEDFSGTSGITSVQQDLDMILDIPVQITVELGRTRLPIKQMLQLAQGSVVELDAFAGEPMNLFVNGCLIAQGEVVVVNERFGIRLTEIVTPSERVKKVNR